MEIRTYKVYKYDELPEEAKAKVLEKYRGINTGYEWYDMTFEEWAGKLSLLGYENTEINFSGFWSQGDGASFTAKRIDLQKWLKAHKCTNHYRSLLKLIEAEEITASVERLTHHYYHANTCRANISANMTNDKQDKLANELEEEIEAERESLSNQLYKQLEKEHEYLTSDEEVIETLKANEYDFTLDGKID